MRLDDLDANKADKNQVERTKEKCHSMDLRIDDVNKVLAVLDKRNGSEDGGILGMINKSDAMNAKLIEMEKDFKELKKIVRGGANQAVN